MTFYDRHTAPNTRCCEYKISEKVVFGHNIFKMLLFHRCCFIHRTRYNHILSINSVKTVEPFLIHAFKKFSKIKYTLICHVESTLPSCTNYNSTIQTFKNLELTVVITTRNVVRHICPLALTFDLVTPE